MLKIMSKLCGKFFNINPPKILLFVLENSIQLEDFINLVSKALKLKIKWRGKGVKEKGYDEDNNCIIECHKKYFRPAEVDTLKR